MDHIQRSVLRDSKDFRASGLSVRRSATDLIEVASSEGNCDSVEERRVLRSIRRSSLNMAVSEAPADSEERKVNH